MSSAQTSATAFVNIVRLSDVRPETVGWFWPGRIPLGKLTILDGDPGLGKSAITVDIAARATRGDTMPDGTVSDVVGPSDVVIVTIEDGLGDTVRPRLDAAGGDPTRVTAIVGIGDDQRPIAIPDDVLAIEEVVRDRQARLVILDPLMGLLSAEVNAYRDQDVRRALAPLAQMAERLSTAVLVVRHPTKAGGANAVHRGGGSIGIIGAARSGLFVVKDPDDPSEVQRVLAASKSNLGPPLPSFAFHIEPAENGSITVAWDGPSEHSANQLLALAADGEERRSALEEALHFLRDALSEGPRPTVDVLREAHQHGLTDPTLRRARKQLDIESKREGFGKEGKWLLALPGTPEARRDHVPLRLKNEPGSIDTSERRCFSCRGARFWTRSDGEAVCAQYHPEPTASAASHEPPF